VKVLLVHGVGLENPDPNWLKPWQDAIAAGLKQYGFAGEPDFAPPVLYDALFEQHMEPVTIKPRKLSAQKRSSRNRSRPGETAHAA
jgi:hypothetical protein